MSEKFRRFVEATRELIAGEKVSTPEKLAKKLKKEIKIFEEYFPSLSEEEREAACKTQFGDLFINPMALQIENKEMRLKLVAADHVHLAAKKIIECLSSYVKDQENFQTARITKIYESFLNRYTISKVGDLPAVLSELIEQIEAVPNPQE